MKYAHSVLWTSSVWKRYKIEKKKAYLRIMNIEMVIAMLILLFNSRAGDNISTVQRMGMDFWYSHETEHE